MILLVLIISFTSLSTKKSNKLTNKVRFTEVIEKVFASDFLEFQKEVNILVEQANVATFNDVLKLKKQIAKTRIAFKKIEFIFDYYHPAFNAGYVNGAPLFRAVEKFGPEKTIEPNGLQTLDEAIYEKKIGNNLDYISELSEKLKERIAYYKKTNLPLEFEDTEIIDALRSGMVRLFTLGVTGFDTPGSGNAIEEGYISFRSMEITFLHFEEYLKPKAKIKFDEIKNIFKEGKRMLRPKNKFDTFDRMVFLKEVINPLYSGLMEFQVLNGIEHKPLRFHAQNYNATNLFDPNFLNTDFYSEFVYLPLDNPKTIKLGKMLFEDPQLSNGSVMSCITCHDPNKGFGDGLAKSKANIKGFFAARNSPTIINAGYSTRYFWDMREYNLEKQVAHVIDNTLEFNTSFTAIVHKLNRNSRYRALFKEAYGDISKKVINQRSISNAIAAYVNSLKSFNSEFDKYVRNETNEYPEAAKQGFNLFMGKGACGTCHFPPMFNGTIPPFYTDSESEVLGVTLGFNPDNPIMDDDLGRINNGLRTDNKPYYKNSFKTVSLRNIELTGPYMHNGLFNTLEEVLEFYNLGGGAGMGLDIENQTLSSAPLGLSKQEIADIITFMKTLTDTSEFQTYND